MAIVQVPSPLSNILAAKLYNAAWFSGATDAAKITAGIAAVVADGANGLVVPANMRPYDASLVTFNAACRMYREDNLTDVFDVKAYGAAGNNIANDLPAFQATAAVMSVNGLFYVPDGNYRLNGLFTPGKAMTILGSGRGAKLIQVASGPSSVLNLTTAFTHVRSLYLVGSGVAGTTNGDSSVVIINADDCEVSDCWIEGGRTNNIFVASCVRARIVRNHLSGVNAASGETDASDIKLVGGSIKHCMIAENRCLSANKNNGIIMQTSGATDVNEFNQIVHNVIDGSVFTAGSTNGHGIALYLVTANSVIRHNTIAYNEIRNCSGMGIYVKGISGSPANDNDVVKNKCINTVTVGTGGTLADGAIGLLEAPRTLVALNSIDSGGSADATVIRVRENSDESIIIGNRARNINGFAQGGISVNASGVSNRISIINNTIVGPCSTAALVLLVQGDQHRVQGNTLRASGGSGIHLITSGNDNELAGNIVQGSTGAAVTIAASAINRTRVLHNRFLGNGSFRSDSGTDTEWRGNRQSTGPIQGRAVLVNGTVTVTTAEVLASDNIGLTRVVGAGTTRGILTVGTITGGTSFVIRAEDLAGALSADDDSTVFWEIVH